jgi:hypothetical protein
MGALRRAAPARRGRHRRVRREPSSRRGGDRGRQEGALPLPDAPQLHLRSPGRVPDLRHASRTDPRGGGRTHGSGNGAWPGTRRARTLRDSDFARTNPADRGPHGRGGAARPGNPARPGGIRVARRAEPAPGADPRRGLGPDAPREPDGRVDPQGTAAPHDLQPRALSERAGVPHRVRRRRFDGRGAARGKRARGVAGPTSSATSSRGSTSEPTRPCSRSPISPRSGCSRISTRWTSAA